MRIRTIKPEFWRNRKLAELGREVHGFAARLLNSADDYGYFEADPALLAGDVMPFDADAQTFIRKALPELERVGFLEVRGGELGVAWIPKFTEHQRINRPSKSRLEPRFSQLTETTQFSEPSVSPHGALSEPSLTERKGNREVEQGKGSGKEVAALAPTTPPAELAPVSVVPPDSPPDAWTADDFWRWAQSKRQQAGLIAERKRPDSRKLSAWYSTVLMTLGGDVAALQEALYRFGDDKHWQQATPPLPFAAFMSQWDKYAPSRGRAHAS